MATLSAANSISTELAVSMSQSTKRIVIKILDSETKQVIKQIPRQELEDVMEDLHQRRLGSLDQTV